MTRRYTFGFLAGGLLLAIPLMAAELPSPDSILDRFIEVTGGKAAYEARKTEVVKGTVEFAAMGLKGSMVTYYQEPGNYYMAMDLAGIGKVETGLIGGVAWENSVLQGARIKTGEEKAQALREAAMNGAFHWRDLFTKAETVGEETVEGEPCYKVVMTPAEGHPVSMYFEEKSGLMRRTSVVAASQLGDIPAESISTEYKRFDGILEPAKVTEKVAGQEFTITIDSATANQPIPPEKFALPEEVKALLAHQKSAAH
jgi:zinc protease